MAIEHDSAFFWRYKGPFGSGTASHGSFSITVGGVTVTHQDGQFGSLSGLWVRQVFYNGPLTLYVFPGGGPSGKPNVFGGEYWGMYQGTAAIRSWQWQGPSNDPNLHIAPCIGRWQVLGEEAESRLPTLPGYDSAVTDPGRYFLRPDGQSVELSSNASAAKIGTSPWWPEPRDIGNRIPISEVMDIGGFGLQVLASTDPRDYVPPVATDLKTEVCGSIKPPV